MLSLLKFKESYEIEDEDIYLQEFEEYFNAKLTEDEKRGTVYFTGKYITWFGTPNKAIVIPIENVHGMYGNIYDQDKIKSLVELIKHSDENVELLTSYGIADVIEFINIKEHQIDVYTDSFLINNDGFDEPYSIGDEDLDKYIGAMGSGNAADLFTTYDDDFIEFVETYKFSLAENDITETELEEVITEFLETQKDILDDDDDFDILTEDIELFQEYEVSLYTAVKDEDGDLGRLMVQLRDGHHRWQAAKEVGEEYIAVDLTDESLKAYKGKYTLLKQKYKED